MKNQFEKSTRKLSTEQTPEEFIITKLGLNKGVRVKLNKISSDQSSEIKDGTSIEGILDEDVCLNKPIFLDGRTKNTSNIFAVKEENKKVFFKTNTSVYELVPPDVQPASLKPQSKELIEIEKNLDIALKIVQANALTKDETNLIYSKKFDLLKLQQTQQIKNEILKIEKEISKHKVTVYTLIEYQMLMNKLGKNYYVVNGTVLHENAHGNKATSIGAVHDGYSVVVYKSKNKGEFTYQPMAHTKVPEDWPKHRQMEAHAKIGFAPEEYGDSMSDGDEDKVETLRKELKDQYNK